jgi:hypothetical protein
MIGGRLFGITDGARYNATDAIDNPIMMLEYIKRNQNWDDNGGTTLIRTGVANGSFDDASLDEVKALTIARQITSEDQQWTDSLTKSICDAFYLVSRQDTEGYECVEYMYRTDTPAETVTIADIVPGSIGLVEEPKSGTVYCEPFIQYGYDYASGKFLHSLRVEGVATNSTWSAALTPGFTGSDGEAVWNACRANYMKYKRIEKINSNLTDQHWIVDYTTALWKITKMVDWMTKKRFSFSVYYSMGRTWYCGKQIEIQFPHETNNASITVLITGIQKDKRNNRVNLKLTILDTIPTAFYFTMYQQADDSEMELQQTDGAEMEMQEQ